ncbi:ABC transporter permease [Ancylobacter sp. Lp-2]|uniref:ABC transporter permease n=1 Tax=Ancylobacter sp. Lp-2 TaxID=2881339 RepID=UPI001E2FD3E2|nr:ABC transporter permease [Ancylobacter sp. Lp-2]MCB4771222.1 ABC transporter permease [Ancylobacter sp. Lp-2]
MSTAPPTSSPSQPALTRCGRLWRGALLPIALIAIWAAISAAGLVNPELFSPPQVVLHTAIEDFASGAVPFALAATLLRALIGSAIGISAGFLVGTLLGLSGIARRIGDPTINSARQIALFAWIPLLSAWFGNGELMKITLIALGAFFPMALAAEAGCRNVPVPYREIGRVLELDRLTTLRRIVLPAATPALLAGLELSLNIAWLGTFGAEYLIGTGYINGMGDGLGAYLAAAREFARMDRVIVGVVSLAVVGLALDRAVVLLSRRALPWSRH